MYREMCPEKLREKSRKVKQHESISGFRFNFSGCKNKTPGYLHINVLEVGEPGYSAMHSNFLLKICPQSSCRNQLQIPNLKMKVTWQGEEGGEGKKCFS